MAANPAFILNTYRDQPYAVRLIGQIRALYPASWIGVISDGEPISDELAASPVNQLVAGDRLKLNQFGGAWSKRFLSLGQGKGDPLIKLDPDSWLWRRFEFFPEADLAGTMIGYISQRIHIIRGGCVAYRQAAIAAILDSGRLDLPCYKEALFYSYRRFGEYRFEGEAESSELIYGEDCTIGHIAKTIGLTIADWSEARICFRESVPDNSDLQWAVTHPHRS